MRTIIDKDIILCYNKVNYSNGGKNYGYNSPQAPQFGGAK